MNQQRREELAEALRGHLPRVPTVDKMLAEDVASIEPIINDIEEQAFRRGQLCAYLQMAYERQLEMERATDGVSV